MQWSNLIKMFQKVTKARVLLLLWEMGILWGSAWALGVMASWLPGWWKVLSILPGFGLILAFHEVVFQRYAERICGVTDVYNNKAGVAKAAVATYCIERWVGPVA